MTINLGDKVRDKLTGIQGIAVTRSFHIDGCVRITVEPPVNENEPHKLPDCIAMDEQRLEVVGRGDYYPEKQAPAAEHLGTGGPQREPSIAR